MKEQREVSSGGNPTLERLKFDTRMIEIHLQRGLITQKDYEEHLGGLEDSAPNAESISPESEERVKEPEESE